MLKYGSNDIEVLDCGSEHSVKCRWTQMDLQNLMEASVYILDEIGIKQNTLYHPRHKFVASPNLRVVSNATESADSVKVWFFSSFSACEVNYSIGNQLHITG